MTHLPFGVDLAGETGGRRLLDIFFVGGATREVTRGGGSLPCGIIRECLYAEEWEYEEQKRMRGIRGSERGVCEKLGRSGQG